MVVSHEKPFFERHGGESASAFGVTKSAAIQYEKNHQELHCIIYENYKCRSYAKLAMGCEQMMWP